jgi:membrane-associated phospholipid phosphatase
MTRLLKSPGVRRFAIEAVVLWAIWLGLQFAYVYVRAVGDDLWQPHDVRAVEEALFFGSAPHALQELFPPDRYGWLADISYVFHGFWFGVPFAYGILVMRYDRNRLWSFVVWTSAISYICAAFFAMVPVRPPWMEGDLTRVLVDGRPDYAALDNNPFAAFPSMHAALPMAIALFMFFGSDRMPRLFSWLVLGYAIGVGVSVVYLGEHWLIDVLAGYAFAAVVCAVCCKGPVRRWLDYPFWHPKPLPTPPGTLEHDTSDLRAA